MNSISRAFFFSLGTVMFLVLALFWVGLAFDFSALENFLVNLCYSLFVGFTIPQLLGSGSVDSIVEQVFRLKIICTICVVLYGIFLFYVGTLKTKKLKLEFLYFSVIVPVTFFLSYLWLKLIREDHILSKVEKVELSQFTIFSLNTTGANGLIDSRYFILRFINLCIFGFRASPIIDLAPKERGPNSIGPLNQPITCPLSRSSAS